MINGSSYFKEQDQVPYDTGIIITYHEKKEIIIPFSERSLRKMNYVIAGDCLQELGFTEIYEKPIRDLVTDGLRKTGLLKRLGLAMFIPLRKIAYSPTM